MANVICEMLGIKYPIFQGGMAWVSEANLAAAVSNAGGLGIIAAGNAPADAIEKEILKIKTLTTKPYGVNIMLLSPFASEIVDLCARERVPVVTTGAGDPQKYFEKLKTAGIKIIPIAPSVAIAKRMEKFGADAVIAEGMEAGGHIGKQTSFALVPQISDAVNIPVIGAGGVADGRGMAAMIMLGAKAVQIGTRFLVADECVVHQNYKTAVIKAKDIDTTITGSITGHPVRSIKNKLTRQFDEAEKEEAKKDVPDIQRIEALGSGALRRSVVEGDTEFGSVMAGQICGLVTKQQSASDIIEEIMFEFTSLLYR